MKYSFPTIQHIDDVERHRADGLIHDAFKRGERRNGTIVYDYAYIDELVFPPIGATPFSAMARELRGLTFDAKTGALLSRPFQKFFNADEREETLSRSLPLADPHLVLEKLDGSMIHAFIQPDGALAFATRWGVTPIAIRALAWREENDQGGAGQAAMRDLVADGWTPVFEWTSPDNIVVVLHETCALTLTGLRHRETGALMPYGDLPGYAAELRTPLVRAFDPIGAWDEFARRAWAETKGEGYVVRFDDGHMIKVKNTLYTRVHKFKANLAFAKDAAEIILRGALDDMLPYLASGERERLEAYRDNLFHQLRASAHIVEATVERAVREIETSDARERQKIFWMSYAEPMGTPLAGCATEVWLGRRDAMDAIQAAVLKNVSTNSKFDAIALVLELPKFSFGFDGDQ